MYISYIEITTSFGRIFSIGYQDEWTSVSRSDPKLKNLLAVIGFEVCLSNKSIKELMIYRSPVKYKKKSKIKVLSVEEINKIRSNMEGLKTQKRSVTLFQNVTRQSILKIRMIKSFGGFKNDSMSTIKFEPESSGKESDAVSRSASAHNTLIKRSSNAKDESHENISVGSPSKNTDLEEMAAMEFAEDAPDDEEKKSSMTFSRSSTIKKAGELRPAGKKRWLTLIKSIADKTNNKLNRVYDEDALHKAQSLSNRPEVLSNDLMQSSDDDVSNQRPKTLSPSHHYDSDSSDKASDGSSPQKLTHKSRFFQPRDLSSTFNEESRGGQNNLLRQSKGLQKSRKPLSKVSGNYIDEILADEEEKKFSPKQKGRRFSIRKGSTSAMNAEVIENTQNGNTARKSSATGAIAINNNDDVKNKDLLKARRRTLPHLNIHISSNGT